MSRQWRPCLSECENAVYGACVEIPSCFTQFAVHHYSCDEIQSRHGVHRHVSTWRKMFESVPAMQVLVTTRVWTLRHFRGLMGTVPRTPSRALSTFAPSATLAHGCQWCLTRLCFTCISRMRDSNFSLLIRKSLRGCRLSVFFSSDTFCRRSLYPAGKWFSKFHRLFEVSMPFRTLSTPPH